MKVTIDPMWLSYPVDVTTHTAYGLTSKATGLTGFKLADKLIIQLNG